MIRLEPVDEHNLWKLIKLSVRDDQRGFVATNTESILEAYLALAAGGVALPFGLYDGDEHVGFAMLGYGTTGDKDEPAVAAGNYCLWRFMLDARYQGRGLGRAALAAVLAHIRTLPCGPADACWLSYEPENAVARALYRSAGFRENGETCGDELVAVLPLKG